MVNPQSEPPELPDPMSESYREQALALIDKLRENVDSEDIEGALDRFQALGQNLHDWQRLVGVRNARIWLEQALQADLLLFNTSAAKHQLGIWESTLNPDEDDSQLQRFRERVETRSQLRQAALMVQGVVAHCENLLTKAAELERSDTPPRPDFLMTNYFEKARAIAAAALAEYDGTPELEMLVQRTERIKGDKEHANRVYDRAFNGDSYTAALEILGQLPHESLVPRYIAAGEGSPPTFHSMVTVPQARQEIQKLATAWAQQRAQATIQQLRQHLESHDPTAALETLADHERYTAYLTGERKDELDSLRQQAENEDKRRKQAQERIDHAMHVAESNPTDAWNAYVEAYNLYQWTPDLDRCREQVVAVLSDQLESIVERAEQAFDARQMQQVRQYYEHALPIYGNKDSALDAQMERLAELESMTQRFEEYLTNASESYAGVKKLLLEDAAGANELLTQLESYPDLVLESFPDLGELRATVNHLLNADQLYGQLYGQLYAEKIDAVDQAMKLAKTGIDEYPDDERFPAIYQALRLHGEFIAAKAEAKTGHIEEAQQLLEPLIAAVNHPDHDAALHLVRTLRGEPPGEKGSQT